MRLLFILRVKKQKKSGNFPKDKRYDKNRCKTEKESGSFVIWPMWGLWWLEKKVLECGGRHSACWLLLSCPLKEGVAWGGGQEDRGQEDRGQKDRGQPGGGPATDSS